MHQHIIRACWENTKELPLMVGFVCKLRLLGSIETFLLCQRYYLNTKISIQGWWKSWSTVISRQAVPSTYPNHTPFLFASKRKNSLFNYPCQTTCQYNLLLVPSNIIMPLGSGIYVSLLWLQLKGRVCMNCAGEETDKRPNWDLPTCLFKVS